jgi:hypothetical protein
MSDPSSGEEQASLQTGGRSKNAPAADGVLSNLPRTRPQRSSARREAERRAPKRTKSPIKQAPTSTKRASSNAKRRRSTGSEPSDPAPRQGFESENDPLDGPVQPPGGVDLLASAAELAGELTKTGLSAGGRLLKDVLQRLPLH